MPERTHGSNFGGTMPVNALQHPGSTAPHRERSAPGSTGELAAPAVSTTGPPYQSGDGSVRDRDSCRHSNSGEPGRAIGVGATLCERFFLEKELGQGGMGTVYRATDQLLGRNVAIKFLNESRTEEDASQIRLEAQILARLVHDQIVRLYDFGEFEGACFLVMEEVNGPSFANRWRDLLLADRLRICGQVAQALHYAHIQGVIHRDVKPSNVLLTPGDQAKLSDFGISIKSGDPSDQIWTIRGTPTYMSPEQAKGMRLDHRTDLYSVGVMLYECVTGDVPFVGDARLIMRQHAGAAPPLHASSTRRSGRRWRG